MLWHLASSHLRWLLHNAILWCNWIVLSFQLGGIRVRHYLHHLQGRCRGCTQEVDLPAEQIPRAPRIVLSFHETEPALQWFLAGAEALAWVCSSDQSFPALKDLSEDSSPDRKLIILPELHSGSTNKQLWTAKASSFSGETSRFCCAQ